jgi:hypothetical protein
MQDKVREDAMFVLQTVHDVIGERVGETVALQEAVRRGGWEPHGSDYNAAVEYLLDNRALELDTRFGAIASGDYPGGFLHFYMTERGRDMLREQ